MEREVVVDVRLDEGKAIRMMFLMSHYRSPMEAGAARLAEARKLLRRFFLAARPTQDGPPEELLAALADDLNTPKAIAIMAGYRKRREGAKLFASLRFLGFMEDVKLPEEIGHLAPGHPMRVEQIVSSALQNTDSGSSGGA